VVENVVTNQAAIDTWRERDCLARNYLYSTLVGDLQETLETCMAAADMWTRVTIQQLQSASQNQQYVQTLDHWKKKDCYARLLIFNSNDETRQKALFNCKTSCEMWNRLTTQYLQRAVDNKHLLRVHQS